MKTQKTQITKTCTVCGATFVAGSNRAKYCPDCKVTANLAVKAACERKRRATKAAADKKPVGLSAHIPNKENPDWVAEERKVKNEMKRTYRNGRGQGSNDAVSARKIALEDLTYDQNENDFKGSIEDFFAGKDD
jgi:predicted  nucleic acid-binding Zn-ribbon protein